MSTRPEERVCPSCRMRYRVGPPTAVEFSNISLDRVAFRLLLSAAREFDDTTEAETPGELYTAVDFLDWIAPFVVDGKAA